MINKLKKWWFGQSISVYPAIPMTGLTGEQVWRKYRQQRIDYNRYGIKVNSPVPGEGIRSNKVLVKDRKGMGAINIWNKDSSQILRSNAIIFEKVNMASQGSIWELVKARGSLFKITVFIHPKPGFISRAQADIVAKTRKSASQQLVEKFGSRHKRFKWRLKMLFYSLPKFVYRQFIELWR